MGKIRVDISTFEGWKSLTSGSHSVKIRAKADGYATSDPSNAVSVVKATWSCLVAGLGSESPSDVTFTHTGTMPDFEQVVFNGDYFVKIPTMYRKVNTVTDSQITSFTIASAKIDDSYQVYPCFLKEDGETIMPYILIGQYGSTSSTTANSQDGASAGASLTKARTLCQARGTGYQQFDWMIQKLWQDLLICKMNTVDTNSGDGIKQDALGINWYQSNSYNTCWVDGIANRAGQWLASMKPSAYVTGQTIDTENYFATGYIAPERPESKETITGCISKLGYDSNHPFVNYPSGIVTDDTYSTYYCDIYMVNASIFSSYYDPIFIMPGYAINSVKYYGAFSIDATGVASSTAYSEKGIRLCYRPIE